VQQASPQDLLEGSKLEMFLFLVALVLAVLPPIVLLGSLIDDFLLSKTVTVS